MDQYESKLLESWDRGMVAYKTEDEIQLVKQAVIETGLGIDQIKVTSPVN
jgi:hypothetical protein